MILKFAFAVNNDHHFEKKHFGDADKYLIYKEDENDITFVSAHINQYKSLDKETMHGSKKKGRAIIDFLKLNGVNVLVSRQFGKNISLINKHFIPVKISSEEPGEVIQILSRHLHWIQDEWEPGKNNFKLFSIKSGILKSSIKDN